MRAIGKFLICQALQRVRLWRLNFALRLGAGQLHHLVGRTHNALDHLRQCFERVTLFIDISVLVVFAPDAANDVAQTAFGNIGGAHLAQLRACGASQIVQSPVTVTPQAWSSLVLFFAWLIDAAHASDAEHEITVCGRCGWLAMIACAVFDNGITVSSLFL